MLHKDLAMEENNAFLVIIQIWLVCYVKIINGNASLLIAMEWLLE